MTAIKRQITTHHTWEILAAAIDSFDGAPSWLKEQARLPYEAVTRLSPLDGTVEGENALPTVDEQPVKSDYLDFLREQIRINARGPEWLELLRERLSALEPFAGRPVITAMFHRKPYSATLRLNPETEKVIHAEVV